MKCDQSFMSLVSLTVVAIATLIALCFKQCGFSQNLVIGHDKQNSNKAKYFQNAVKIMIKK